MHKRKDGNFTYFDNNKTEQKYRNCFDLQYESNLPARPPRRNPVNSIPLSRFELETLRICEKKTGIESPF